MTGIAASAGALAALVAAGALASTSVQPGPPAAQQVLFVGDSVPTSITDNPGPKATVAQGVDMDFALAPCRRLVGTSCPYEGKRPPNVLDLIKSLGPAVPPTVVVAVGYNDYEDQYAAGIAAVLGALEQAGVKHVLWLDLHAVRHPYLSMNDDILAAAAAHPELTVVDWNGAAQGHPGWFQDDGVHLEGDGTAAMAALIHDTLVQLGVASAPPAATIGTTTTTAPAKIAAPPVRVATRSLPAAHRGKRYRVQLRAAAGTPPYTWSFPRRPPPGLHVRPDGIVFGTPTGKAGTFRFAVSVADAAGRRAREILRLRIRR